MPSLAFYYSIHARQQISTEKEKIPEKNSAAGIFRRGRNREALIAPASPRSPGELAWEIAWAFPGICFREVTISPSGLLLSLQQQGGNLDLAGRTDFVAQAQFDQLADAVRELGVIDTAGRDFRIPVLKFPEMPLAGEQEIVSGPSSELPGDGSHPLGDDVIVTDHGLGIVQGLVIGLQEFTGQLKFAEHIEIIHILQRQDLPGAVRMRTQRPLESHQLHFRIIPVEFRAQSLDVAAGDEQEFAFPHRVKIFKELFDLVVVAPEQEIKLRIDAGEIAVAAHFPGGIDFDQRQIAPEQRIAHQVVQLAEVDQAIQLEQAGVPVVAGIFVIDPENLQRHVQPGIQDALQIAQEPLDQRIGGNAQHRQPAILPEDETDLAVTLRIPAHQDAADVGSIVEFEHCPFHAITRFPGDWKHLRAVDEAGHGCRRDLRHSSNRIDINFCSLAIHLLTIVPSLEYLSSC